MGIPFIRRGNKQQGADAVGQRAGELFDRGMNCAQAVLQAATGRTDAELMAVAGAFGGGIGDSRCLCGAVSGGVMALGLRGKGDKSGALVAAFKADHRVTCCKALSAPYRWLGPQHLAHCRRLTVKTAETVARLLK